MTPAETPGAGVEAALQIIEEAWGEFRRCTYVQHKLGIIPSRLPDLSFEAAQRRSALGKSLQKRIAALDNPIIPHDVALTLRAVKYRASTWAREEEWYWTVIDPVGVGIFGMFLPTAYCGGWFLDHIHGHFASCSIASSEDADRYIELVGDYGRLIEQFVLRTAGQAERGMRMPRAQVRQARDLLASLKANLRNTLAVPDRPVVGLSKARFLQDLDGCIAGKVGPAFDAALDGLNDDYVRLAPETVGLGQYAAGLEIYDDLAKLHTTMDLTPQQVHERGYARMAEIQSDMRAIRSEMGFDGDSTAFQDQLNHDVSWRADTVEDLTAFFGRYIQRVQPHLAKCFHTMPKAEFGVAALPETLQRSMTYGYYDAPREGNRRGQYLFNVSNLSSQALHRLGTLTYHELMPGHHLQIALQQENETLHPMRRYGFITAHGEGWAEYAATLAGELGCYALPEERYGRLDMEACLTCRLVVDTGMNALGWSLEHAQQYMKACTSMTDAEIYSESVRYSCDIPGQGLAYKVGDAKLFELRERMRILKGGDFDLKAFHAAVLKETGAIPLPDVEWHVERTVIGPHVDREGHL